MANENCGLPETEVDWTSDAPRGRVRDDTSLPGVAIGRADRLGPLLVASKFKNAIRRKTLRYPYRKTPIAALEKDFGQ